MAEFLAGRVVSGLGEGQRFLSLHEYRHEVREKLGFFPFPGTLNLEVDVGKMKEFLKESEPIELEGFERSGSRFNPLTAYRVWIASFDSAIVVPEKNRHPENVVEVISEKNLREKLALENGDVVRMQRLG